MKRSITFLLPLALLASLGGSWLLLVVAPGLQLRPIASAPSPEADPPDSLAAQGSRVYAANNCAACHTQQVAPGDTAALTRGWARRPTTPRDFLSAHPAMPGFLRIGPDLSDIAHRETADSLAHRLDAPPPGSAMPPYRFLFEPGPGIVPTPEGQALIAYLLTLERPAALPAP